MAKPELGSKRQCLSCAAKFFDLGRNPIVCPKCGTVFQAAPVRAAAARPVAKEEDAETPAAAELVPLEEADAAAAAAEPVVGDDAELVEDDQAADDTFLEEDEEENDDVAGLIDGDIETDEET